MEIKVKLNNLEEVKNLSNIALRYDAPIFVRNEDRKLQVDASSIMGVMNLDLGKTLIVSVDDAEQALLFKDDVKEFLVEE